MDNTTPPEDSIFSLPPYKAGQFNSSATSVQMDPATAMKQGETKSTVRNLIRGVSMAIVVLAVIGGSVAFILSKSATSTQASIDLKHAVMGTVGTVSEAENTFTLTNTTTEDPTILDTGVRDWMIQLPPGASLANKDEHALSACYTISSFQHNFKEAISVSCLHFLTPGSKAVVEYIIMKPETSHIISKKIIREE